MMKKLSLSLFLFAGVTAFAQTISDVNAVIELLPSTYYSSVAWTAKTYIANFGNPQAWGGVTEVQGTPPDDEQSNPWYSPAYSLTDGDFQWQTTSSPYYSESYYNGLPSTVWCTGSDTADIYIRREFSLTDDSFGDVYLASRHDDGDSQFYLNGVLVYSTGTDWEESDYVKLTGEQAALLKTDGTANLLAVHVHNNYGGAYADCGLYATDPDAELLGNLPMGYNSPWTARLMYNSEGGYNWQLNNIENDIHGWEKLYEATENDVYTITMPVAAFDGYNALVQFKTPINIDPSHTYRISMTLSSSEDMYDVIVTGSESENDNIILFSSNTIGLTPDAAYSYSQSNIQGVSIEDLKIELQLPTLVDNTVVTISGMSFYDQTDQKELFIGTSYFNWCYYRNPDTGERIKDMTIEGRRETLSWATAEFDDSQWQEALMPIGSSGFIDEVQTLWDGSNNNYWIRRSFTLSRVSPTTKYTLKLCHDDCFSLYVNGHFIASDTGWTTGKDYETYEIPADYLNEGDNVIATYIQQNWGGCFYDCGMEIKEDYYEEYDLDGDPNVLEINEVQVSNIDQFIDYSYNYGSWIELYNPSDKIIRLDRLCVSDDPADTEKFALPYGFGVIAAKGYQLIFFGHPSSDGNYGDTAFKQVNFKLNTDGGTILLANNDGTIISQVDYPGAVARCSYARIDNNGEEWGMTGEPTPGASNAGSAFSNERLPAPEVNTDSRLFTDPFSIRVDIPAGATLVYTLDGSTPTAANGTVSGNGRFVVSETSIFRFRLFEDGKLPSQVITRSYIYRDRDYYLPVISISTDAANLYDDTIGVYVDGTNGISGNNYSNSNLNMDWDRPVNFEYITADNQMGVSMEVEFSISGGWSRHYAPASFKIKATKYYEGLNSIDYPFFPYHPYNKYKQILIRNGGNDNDSSSHGRVRDAITQSTLMSSGVYVDAQDYQPVHVFMNGEYVGLLNLREPNNRYHGTANYGYDDDEMDAFEYSNGYFQKAGTRDFFDYWLSLSAGAGDDAVYETLRQDVVDMDEFINYWAAASYIGCNDWIFNSNNLKGYRSLPDGRFRLTLFDQDSGWSNSNNVSLINGNYGNDILTIYNNTKKNSRFCRQFVDAYCIMAGSVFTSERCEAIGDSICDLVQQGLAMEHRDPYTSYNEQFYNMTNESSREKRISALRDSYNLGEGMQVTFKSNISSAAFLLNSQSVPTAQFSGTLFAPVEIEASAGAGYNFVGWQRTDLSGSPVVCFDRTISIDSDEDMELLAVFEPVSDEFKIMAGAPPVVVNEVSADNSIFVNDYIKRNDWVELYNTTDSEVDVEGMYLTDDTDDPYKYQISSEGTEASTVISPHGYLVIWADKLNPLMQLHSSFKLGNEDDEKVMLTAKDKSWSDTLTYIAHTGEESVGRYPDGGKRIYRMSKPSIAATNWINTYAEWTSGEDVNFDETALPDKINSAAPVRQNAAVEYFTTDGIRLETPRHGVNIVRKTETDGTVSTRRIIIP